MSVVLALSSVGGGALSAFATTISNDSASQQGAEANAVPGHLAAVVAVGAQIYQQREAEEAARAAAEEQARQEAAARAAEQRAAQERAARAAAQRAYEAEQAAAQAAAEMMEPSTEGADASRAPVQIVPAETGEGAGNQNEQAPGDQDAISPATEPQASPDELEGHVVSGLNPENTTINLFNYSATGADASVTSDINGSTGGATPATNYQTWLNNPNSINYGHMLTFGDGMRHLGYWNQGIVESYGDIAEDRPGMQGIVSPWLDENGYPSVNAGTYYQDTDGNISLSPSEGATTIDTTLGPNI